MKSLRLKYINNINGEEKYNSLLFSKSKTFIKLIKLNMKLINDSDQIKQDLNIDNYTLLFNNRIVFHTYNHKLFLDNKHNYQEILDENTFNKYVFEIFINTDIEEIIFYMIIINNSILDELKWLNLYSNHSEDYEYYGMEIKYINFLNNYYDEIKDNNEILKYLVRNSDVIYFELIKNDEKYKSNKELIFFASLCQNNDNIILNRQNLIDSISVELRNDEDFLFEGFKYYGFNFRIFPKNILSNKNFVIKCLETGKIGKFDYQFISDNLKHDNDILIYKK